MEYPELEKTYKDHQIQALTLHRTQKNPPTLLGALSKPQSLELLPHDTLREELFPKIQLKHISSNPSCLSAPPVFRASYLGIFHLFSVFPKLYLSSFLQQQLHAVGISHHAGAVQGFEGAVQAVHIGALRSRGAPRSGTPPFPSLQKGLNHTNPGGQQIPPFPCPSHPFKKGLIKRNPVGSFVRMLPALIPAPACVSPIHRHQTVPGDPGGPEGGRKSLESLNQPEMP